MKKTEHVSLYVHCTSTFPHYALLIICSGLFNVALSCYKNVYKEKQGMVPWTYYGPLFSIQDSPCRFRTLNHYHTKDAEMVPNSFAN